MDALVSLLPFVLIAAVFWLLMIRPAQRRQREARLVQGSAEVGTEVLLTSGIYGRVVEAGEEDLRIEVSPGTTMKIVRAAVLRVVTDAEVPESPEVAEQRSDLGPTSDPAPTEGTESTEH